MTKDEIRQALHLLAMGRMHPLHDQLAEKLTEAFAPKGIEVVRPQFLDGVSDAVKRRTKAD